METLAKRLIESLNRDPEPSKGVKTLSQIKVSEDIFNSIIRDNRELVRIIPNLKKYYRGFNSKFQILYNGQIGVHGIIICELCLISRYTKVKEDRTWRQVIVRQDESLDVSTYVSDYTGVYAWNHMFSVLKEFYSKDEVLEILKSYKNEYDSKLAQKHLVNFGLGYRVHKNCYYYDINGAHADALCEMFPKAAGKIIKLRDLSKKNQEIKRRTKNLFNYFVGYMKHKGYDGAYNFVVQRTTKKLMEAICYTDGKLLYVNTDGFIVQDPKRLLKTSNKLGEFKREPEQSEPSTVYSYTALSTLTSTGYWLFQVDDLKMKGTLIATARDKIDLKNGRVVDIKITNNNNNYKEIRKLEEVKVI